MLATPIKQKLEKQVKARCRSGFEPENCWTVERHNTADHRHTTGSRSWLCGELWHLDMGPDSRAKTISDYLDSGQLPDMRLFPLQSENVIMWFAAWFHWSPDCLEWNSLTAVTVGKSNSVCPCLPSRTYCMRSVNLWGCTDPSHTSVVNEGKLCNTGLLKSQISAAPRVLVCVSDWLTVRELDVIFLQRIITGFCRRMWVNPLLRKDRPNDSVLLQVMGLMVHTLTSTS